MIFPSIASAIILTKISDICCKSVTAAICRLSTYKASVRLSLFRVFFQFIPELGGHGGDDDCNQQVDYESEQVL